MTKEEEMDKVILSIIDAAENLRPEESADGLEKEEVGPIMDEHSDIPAVYSADTLEIQADRVDYNELFNYLGMHRQVEQIYESYKEAITEDGGKELLNNEEVERIVTLEKLATIFGTTNLMQADLKEAYELQKRMSTFAALFQVKYEMGG